jgi:hypothetical protein
MGEAELNGMATAVGERFAHEWDAQAGRITELVAIAKAATDAANAATARATELAAQMQAQAQAFDVLRAHVSTATESSGAAGVAHMAVDGSRIVVRCLDGREWAAELPRPDPAAVALLVIEKHLDKLRGDKGDKGDQGDEGPRPIIDLSDLAGVLRAEPEFIESVRGPRGEQGLPGQPCAAWKAGVYRANTRCSHFIGRVYEAVADTSDEPGDSAQWRRIDTVGMRHVGPRDPAEAGDIHTRDDATFLFDGARSWLLCAKAFTAADGERIVNPLADAVKGFRTRLGNVDARAQAAAELAGVAHADAARAWAWITQRTAAIDEWLGGA